MPVAGGGKYLGEELLAFADGEVAGVVAVEVEEVEDEVGEGVALALVEGGLEVGEGGDAAARRERRPRRRG